MAALAVAAWLSACSLVVETDECTADDDCRLDDDTSHECVAGECVRVGESASGGPDLGLDAADAEEVR